MAVKYNALFYDWIEYSKAYQAGPRYSVDGTKEALDTYLRTPTKYNFPRAFTRILRLSAKIELGIPEVYTGRGNVETFKECGGYCYGRSRLWL